MGAFACLSKWMRTPATETRPAAPAIRERGQGAVPNTRPAPASKPLAQSYRQHAQQRHRLCVPASTGARPLPGPEPGARVQVFGLRSAFGQAFNGMQGLVRDAGQQAGRVPVLLDMVLDVGTAGVDAKLRPVHRPARSFSLTNLRIIPHPVHVQ